jgi:hypothetical protein
MKDKPDLVPAPGLVPNPKSLPSPEEHQNVSIRPGSKLAVLGVFVEIIRRRFAANNVPENFQWRWDPDISATRLAVESAFNEDKTHRNFRPAVYVDCDDQTMGRVVLGDRVTQNLKTGLEKFWNLQSVPILIECVAAKRAESATVGDLVGTFLHATSDLVQGKFGFHDMTPVTVGRTQPTPRDKDQWVTPVTFVVQAPFRWTNIRTASLLQEVELAIVNCGVETATEYFESIALNWRR